MRRQLARARAEVNRKLSALKSTTVQGDSHCTGGTSHQPWSSDTDGSSEIDDSSDSDGSDDGGSSSPHTSDGNSSSSQSDTLTDPPGSLRSDLAYWQATRNVPLNAVTELLHILRRHGVEDIPLDARTLMQTPMNVQLIVRTVGGPLHQALTINSV